MTKLFIDTDIALDLLSERQPHYPFAAQLFTMADKGKIKLHISSLSFANLNYLLTKQYNSIESRRILKNLKVLTKVLSAGDKIIDLALSSKFSDFEDAIQYFTAVENDIPVLITKNVKNYKNAEIPVLTAEAFIKQP